MSALNHIFERIESKKDNYAHYNFTHEQYTALMTFFDLAQEFDNFGDFYNLCVAIPKRFFNIEARLYIIDPRFNELSLFSQTEEDGQELHSTPPPDITLQEHPYHTERDSYVSPIRGKSFLMDQLPFKTSSDVFGVLEVYPAAGLDRSQELFFEKYANRIGFSMHNRFVVVKNIEHLRFIRTLVADIEHNVIAPNMVYKLFLKRLKGKILKNREIERSLAVCFLEGGDCRKCLEDMLVELSDVNHSLTEEFDALEKHYQNISLFLETLFRRSHFDQGRLTLRTKQCNMKKDVVQPQLDRYLEQFRSMNISIDDRFSGIPDEEVISVVDVGLIAQVYANLFSNAVKYTQEITTHDGEKKKYIAYGREVIRDCFGPGRDGIKYNVFSTGPHIPEEERGRVFEDDFRGSNAAEKPGTGHGLTFIKNAVEIHGGCVGYEPTQYGNNFYFILPK